MKKILISLSIALVLLVSCDKDSETSNAIYNSSENASGVMGFAESSYDLSVVENTQNATVDVTIDISTASSVDRTYALSVNDESTANPDNYEIPDTVVVPAGAYNGTFTITGNDMSIEPDPETIIVDITDITDDNIFLEFPQTVVSLFEVCPAPDTYFVGSYNLLNLQQVMGPTFGDQNLEAGPVTLVAVSPTKRSFQAAILPRNGGAVNEIILDLACGNLSLASSINFNSAGTSTIEHTPNGVLTPYDLSDDSSFIISYTENANSTNGLAAQNASFLLQKN
jgi:hypothetical protein